MARDYKFFRTCLISEMYEDYLQDEEAPSLSAVRERCYSAAQAAAKRWSDQDVAHWFLNWR